MPNKKKIKPEAECKNQFARTVKKTGRWRGMKPEDYKQRFGERGFRSGRVPKECEHNFDDGTCTKCFMSFKTFMKLHPRLAKRMLGIKIRVKK